METDRPDLAEPKLRHQLIHVVLVLFAVALVARAATVQLWQHEQWTAQARAYQTMTDSTTTPRGVIEDVNGVQLAFGRELVRVAVARDQVSDLAALKREMTAAGVPAAEVRRISSHKKPWIPLRGIYLPSRMNKVRRLGGVHFTTVADREYIPSAGARQVLGTVGPDGRGRSGMERALDSLLTGAAGRSLATKGRGGSIFESVAMLDAPPRRGHDVRLTINSVLQGICDKALGDAVRRLRADGGDVLVLNPRTGELLCLSGRRPGDNFGGATALIEPYEPGSTLKPFFAARLLELERARPDEIVPTYNGRHAFDGRIISDVHKAERMSLSDVIRFSSNIGIVQFAERLSNGEVYQLLRDLGFGSPTGIPYPGEAAGVLRHPRGWQRPSRASHAIGYELSVTPLQLALAYSVFANRGAVVEPALIREIRDAEGAVVYRHQPRMLRQVFAPEAVDRVLPMLESVVDSGTAEGARLERFTVAGKSGTSRAFTAGRYAGKYTSTFVGLFPAREPQFVVLAKVDNPRQESIYGGKVAAPIMKAVIQGALAAQDASLNWGELAGQQRDISPVDRPTTTMVATGSVEPRALDAAHERAALVHTAWTAAGDTADAPRTFVVGQPMRAAPRPARTVVVPEVGGLPLRVAIRELHRVGLQVRLATGAPGTVPAAGARVALGSVVRLLRQ